MAGSMSFSLRFVTGLALLALSQLAAFLPRAAGAGADDPRRLLQVKEWAGTLRTAAQSSGERKAPGSTVTFSSAITVTGRFQLAPHQDARNLDSLSWRGKGEALVRVTGKRTTQYPDEIVTDTYVGSYVDAFEVIISNLKFDVGTYQMAVIRDLWQKQAHRGKAIEHTSVRRTRYGTYTTVEMVPGHSWPDDGGAGFGRESPLPKKGFVIPGAMTSDNDDFLSQDGSRWVTSWSIRPVGPEYDEPLKAVAGGPYTIERGKNLALDGFESTGKIRSYRWTFEPADAKSAIPFNSGAAKSGRRVETVLLATVKATLTVSDGKKEDSDSVIVAVNPREYQTPFVHREQEKRHPRSVPPRYIKGHDLRYAGGENVCALDEYNAAHSVHVLHPGAAGDSWETRGYTLKQVQDPGGPFDADWFVDTYTLRIEREVLINKYILPGGPPPVRTAKRFYTANKELGHDVDGYLAAVRRHELLHSDLMRNALVTNDPGPRIETLAARGKDALKLEVDQQIRTAEKAIDHASEDPLPSVGFKGPIAFPDDATDKYVPFEMQL